MKTALFGAGCFWGVEDTFRQIDGVTDTAVGYAGGHTENATYEEVCSGKTGHAEVVKVEFDPEKVSYDQLLETFWGCHNPTTLNRQGPDIGTQYRSIILYFDEVQKEAAEASKNQQMLSGKYNGPIVTEIVEAGEFHMAEEYHQQYFEKKGISHCRVA